MSAEPLTPDEFAEIVGDLKRGYVYPITREYVARLVATVEALTARLAAAHSVLGTVLYAAREDGGVYVALREDVNLVNDFDDLTPAEAAEIRAATEDTDR
jgi:hypothetical protein